MSSHSHIVATKYFNLKACTLHLNVDRKHEHHFILFPTAAIVQKRSLLENKEMLLIYRFHYLSFISSHGQNLSCSSTIPLILEKHLLSIQSAHFTYLSVMINLLQFVCFLFHSFLFPLFKKPISRKIAFFSARQICSTHPLILNI